MTSGTGRGSKISEIGLADDTKRVAVVAKDMSLVRIRGLARRVSEAQRANTKRHTGRL